MNWEKIKTNWWEISQNQKIEKKEASELWNIPKLDFLKTFDKFENIYDSLNGLSNDKKKEFFTILEKIPNDELDMYINIDLSGIVFPKTIAIEEFILAKEKDYGSKQEEEKAKLAQKDSQFNNVDIIIENNNRVPESDKLNEIETKNRETETKTNEDKKDTLNEEKDQALKNLKENTSKFKEIFWGDSEFFQFFEKYKDWELETKLTEFLSKPENRKAVFDKIAATWDEKLYQETYNSLSKLSPEIKSYLSDIPSTIYKVEKIDTTKTEDKSILSQFPWAKPEDIEKRWNLVSYWDKTIDIKTGKAYISWEKWYAIETSMKVPNSLDARVKYQKERLETLEEIKTNEKILTLVERKQTLKQNLEKLKSQKSSEWQNAQDLQIDIEINTLSKELEAINEKLKTIIPGYKEEQDEMFIRFLEEKIIQWKEKLISLKENFDFEMKELLDAGKDEIITRDKNVRETIDFLDDLWITNINQNDLQKIINRVNIIPQAFGFSKRIDLKAGFEWTPTDALQQKKELFKLFSKLYEKMDFTPPVNESIITWFPKDERLKNDTIFKQKLEDLNLTKGGSIQIETMMSLLWEKTQERERKYPWKPSSKPIHQEIPVETK